MNFKIDIFDRVLSKKYIASYVVYKFSKHFRLEITIYTRFKENTLNDEQTFYNYDYHSEFLQEKTDYFGTNKHTEFIQTEGQQTPEYIKRKASKHVLKAIKETRKILNNGRKMQ